MFLLVVFICIVADDDISVDCANNLQVQKGAKNNTNVHLSMLNHHDNQMFCKVGCVLNDPKNRLRIDDPGRNIYDKFSVISTSYVIEVIGSKDGLVDHPLRVMASQRTLSEMLRTSIELQRLSLSNGELIQRITFNLKTDFTVIRRSRRSKAITIRIPSVVPHVILIYDYALELSGEQNVSGVVSVEVSDHPRTLEVKVVRDDSGMCWMKPVDESIFKNYQVSLKVRGENRHVMGTVSTIIHSELIENGFPFEMYMKQINEFAFKFLTEALLRDTEVIKTSSIFNDLCDTIRPDPTPDRDHVSRDDRSSSRDDRSSSRDDKSSSRDDIYLSQDDRSSSRDDRSLSRDDRSSNPDDCSSSPDDRSSSPDDCSSSPDDCSSRRDDRYSCKDGDSCEDSSCEDNNCEEDPCKSHKGCRRTIRIKIKTG